MIVKQSVTHFKGCWVISLQRISCKIPYIRNNVGIGWQCRLVLKKKAEHKEKGRKVCVAYVHHRKRRALPARPAYLWPQ